MKYMSNLPGTWTYHKSYSRPDPLWEPTIMIYYPKAKDMRLMVTLEELEKNRSNYSDWKVYEGITGNKFVGDWLNMQKEKAK
jgi:hypothetical protein